MQSPKPPPGYGTPRDADCPKTRQELLEELRYLLFDMRKWDIILADYKDEYLNPTGMIW